MASSASSSTPSADSYIGSLISLTSKCEIRYEGILYNINTDESSIGLRNVRSFGTEGRKKDGPQVPANDKTYDYILFRGSDIKDLQVKATAPAHAATIHNDPAIIQSNFSQPASAPISLPTVGSGTVADLSSHTAQLGLPRSTFSGGLPLYQPGGNIGSWGATTPPPNASGPGLAMPMYWQGFYAPSGGLPHLQQSTLLRPSPGLPIPPSLQQPMHYPGINATLHSGSPNLSELTPLFQPASNPQSLTSITLPSTVAPTQASVLAPESATTMMPNRPLVDALPATTAGAHLPFIPPLTSRHDPSITIPQNMPSAVGSNPRTVVAPNLAYQTMSQSVPSMVGLSSQNQVESSVGLVTPSQLLQPGPPTRPSSEPLQASLKNVEVKPEDEKIKHYPTAAPTHASAVAKEPILPLPKPFHQKPNGAALQNHHYNRVQNHHYNQGRGRGRGRGRGNGYSHPVTQFTEDFDFMAMNEKFNKDEVWGHLGKSKDLSHDPEGEAKDDEADYSQEEDDPESLKVKPVYVKDDFFDTLSCNTLSHGDRGGRTRFSEQLKIDAETFGDFPRHRPAWGGGRGFRGGRPGRGPRGGRGYGYGGRGRSLNRGS